MTTIRLVRDDDVRPGMELARRLFCCAPTGALGVPCMRARQHEGGHLPLPSVMPLRHVGPENPAWRPEGGAA